jgi:uncharacterized LabA/DUF88 family protein
LGTLVIKPKFKVVCYIDGYNLYHGMRDKARIVDDRGKCVNRHWFKYMWLDLVKFSASLLRPDQELMMTKYFTSRISGKIGSVERQSAWLDAISILPNLKTFEGKFQPDPKDCLKCQTKSFHPQEKKTDVNIATQMIFDAYKNHYDTALLISGDSDQVPTIEMIREEFKKDVIVGFPPERLSADLQMVATTNFRIGEQKFREAIMDPTITLPNGIIIKCPGKWR